MDALKRICVVNCGLPAENCACYRDMMNAITEHDRIVAEKDAEIARLREALTPSAETKAAYWSEVECDCPTETWRHYVPWTSIKQIMKMIRARAALKGDSDE